MKRSVAKDRPWVISQQTQLGQNRVGISKNMVSSCFIIDRPHIWPFLGDILKGNALQGKTKWLFEHIGGFRNNVEHSTRVQAGHEMDVVTLSSLMNSHMTILRTSYDYCWTFWTFWTFWPFPEQCEAQHMRTSWPWNWCR